MKVQLFKYLGVSLIAVALLLFYFNMQNLVGKVMSKMVQVESSRLLRDHVHRARGLTRKRLTKGAR